MELPVDFLNKMRQMLGEKYYLYEQALDKPPFKALRINTLKADYSLLKNHFDFLNESTSFCENSFYIPESFQKPGNHPLHHAGAFYMQEPSASSVVEAIGIEEGDVVLDLCASPGGKSTQAATKLNNTGLLISNEFVSSRVKPLVSNIERMGIVNAVVTSLRPDVLAENLPEFFDKVIVDAPCSGEGMFRKESAAIENGSQENVISCAERQLKILESAAKCVKSGGKLVYSTCTYSYEENEQNVQLFLDAHPDFKLVKPAKDFGEPAFKDFAPSVENIDFARRIFNFNGGEGHFVAVFERDGSRSTTNIENNPQIFNYKSKELQLFSDFYKENFEGEVPQNVISNSGFVYIIPYNLEKIRSVCNGIFAGVCKNGRFVPEHALFNNNVHIPQRIVNLNLDDERLYKFLHGEEIAVDSELKGYVQIRCEGVPLGFGKASSGVLKNHYPKGLRTL